MTRHVDLLGILYMSCGGLSLLLAVALLALAFGATAIVTTPADPRSGFAASMTTVGFFTMALVALVWGVMSLWAGASLRQRKAWARLVVLAMAVLSLFVLPFGTALGLYSLWVLLDDRSRQLFES